MKKLTAKIFLIAIALMFSTSSVFAAVLTQQQLAAIVEKQTIKQLAPKVNGKIEAKALLLPFNQFTLPDGKMTVKVDLDSYTFAPRKYAKITIRVNGKKIKGFPTPIQLKLYQDVWIATDNIARNSSLSTSEFTSQRKDVTRIYSLVITTDKNISDYVSTRDIRSGSIIDKRYVMPRPDVAKNSVVSVIFDTGTIKISIDAEALQNGCIGDPVRIRSDEYRRFYTGTVIGTNKVLVKI